MSMPFTELSHREQAAIDAMRGWLVDQAQGLAVRLVRSAPGAGSGDEGAGESAGLSQLAKAMEVAERSPSLQVLLNWLLYQAARRASSGIWGASLPGRGGGSGDSLFAREVERKLLDLRQRLSQHVSQERLETVTMRCAALFFGYLRRSMVAAPLLDSGRQPAGERR